MNPAGLRALLGNIDIYLFDQVHRGCLGEDDIVLDAGCGGGRNVEYLLRCGTEVYGVDSSDEAVASVRAMADAIRPGYPAERFRTGALSAIPFKDARFTFVICNAVLHFMPSSAEWAASVQEMARVTRPGGRVFLRFMSQREMDGIGQPAGEFLRRIDHGRTLFLPPDDWVEAQFRAAGLVPVEEPKTVQVHGRRSMSVWVVGRDGHLGARSASSA